MYCEKLHEKAASERNLLDKVTNKASETWAAWEKDEKAIGNWKKKVTVYGNHALKRIPYEEWGLKTLPPLTSRRKKELEKEKVGILFPGLYLREERIPIILQSLATKRQAMHKKRMFWSIVAMPFTIPFALIPMCVPSIGAQENHRANLLQHPQSAVLLSCIQGIFSLERYKFIHPGRRFRH